MVVLFPKVSAVYSQIFDDDVRLKSIEKFDKNVVNGSRIKIRKCLLPLVEQVIS